MDDERTLIQRSQQGDERAFGTLIRGYEGRLSTLIRYTLDGDADHDEVMQDTLMAAWRSLPALRELDRFAPWLFAIARNRLRDATRAWTRRDTPTADGAERSRWTHHGRASRNARVVRPARRRPGLASRATTCHASVLRRRSHNRGNRRTARVARRNRQAPTLRVQTPASA